MHVTCETCGITIHWQPTIVDARFYCCIGCAQGGPCTCDYGQLPQRGDHAALAVRDGRLDPPHDNLGATLS